MLFGRRCGIGLALIGAAGMVFYGVQELFVMLPHWLRHQIWSWHGWFEPMFCAGMVMALGLAPDRKPASSPQDPSGR